MSMGYEVIYCSLTSAVEFKPDLKIYTGLLINDQ